MITADPAKALLLSIHPRYTELILAGSKTIELRKRQPRVPSGTLVVMYASQPTCALVGAFVLRGVVNRPPTKLWSEHGSQTGVSKETFERYYADHECAYGLLVGEVMPVEHEVSLATLRRRWRGFHPPQSYRYLDLVRTEESLELRFSTETAYLALPASS